MFTKFTQYQSETIVAFAPFIKEFFNGNKEQNEIYDTPYHIGKALDRCGSQVCEEREQYNFNLFHFVKFNAWKKMVDSIRITFTDNSVIIGNREYKLVEKGFSYDYTYKILKTQINVASIENFKKHIIDTMDMKSPFHAVTFSMLKKLGE